MVRMVSGERHEMVEPERHRRLGGSSVGGSGVVQLVHAHTLCIPYREPHAFGEAKRHVTKSMSPESQETWEDPTMR